MPPYAAPPGWQPPAPAPQYAPAYGQPAPPAGGAGWHGAGSYGQHSPPPAPHGQPPYGYGQPPYGYGQQPYGGYPRPGDTNGYAIASLVCSLVGILVLVIGPALGILFGILGLRQLNTSGQSGRGLALAGIIIGSIVLLLDVLGIIGLAVGTTTSTGGGGLSTMPLALLSLG